MAKLDSTERWFIGYRIVGAVFGWVWLLSIPATIGSIVYAVFFGGAWKYVLFSLIVGGLGKWLLRGFNVHSERVAVEAYLIAHGASKEAASAAWLDLYSEGGSVAAKQVVYMNDAELARLCRLT